MKTRLALMSLLLSGLFALLSTDVSAQTDNPWNGPRWSSVKVAQVVNQYILANGLLPEGDEWVSTRYSWAGNGTWRVVISWGTGMFGENILGSTTLLIKNSGTIL